MDKQANQSDRWDATVKRWAWVRIVLGWLQMAGAAASVVLLIQTGTSAASVAVVWLSAFFMVISVILFRVLKLPKPSRRLS